MSAYYNENDPKAAAWLRELIRDGHIAPGDVDERSIEDVIPNELHKYRQCHFFAGIGGWSYALRLVGWPDDRAVWTGSCPCQPFSAAGKGAGFADERHLWPAWFHLIAQCRPERIFGEQVANAMQWIDLVQGDLEAEEYTFGFAVLGAHSVGAPHIRQRFYWMANNNSAGRGVEWRPELLDGERSALQPQGRGADKLADSPRDRRREERADAGRQLEGDSTQGRPAGLEPSGVLDELGNPDDAGSQGRRIRWDGTGERTTWAADLVGCRDGKWRPVEPGSFPLAHGVPGRVGLLRGYGNAIVPQVAAAFIEATGLA